MSKQRGKGEVESVASLVGSQIDAGSGVGTEVGLELLSAAASLPSLIPLMQGDGVQVSLYAIPELTDKRVLKEPFYFQAPPLEQLTQQYRYNWTTFSTVSKGEFSRPSGRALSSLPLSTVFVDYDAIWTNLRQTRTLGAQPINTQNIARNPAGRYKNVNPIQMVRKLILLQRSGTPFELIVGQHRLWGQQDVHWGPTNKNAAVITDLQVEERAGEIDARYVTVTFQEYRSAGLNTRGVLELRGRNYPKTVKVGRAATFTLQDIAREAYGEGSAWRRIAKANGINWPGGEPLGEWITKRGENQHIVQVPKPPSRKKDGDG
jgi:hypothetical protein